MLTRLFTSLAHRALGSLARATDFALDADARLVLLPNCLPGAGRPTAQILSFPVRPSRNLATAAENRLQAAIAPAHSHRTQI